MNEIRHFPRRVNSEFRPRQESDTMLGGSKRFRTMVTKLKQAAAWNHEPVLLVGERGAGKEVAARALHRWSSRRTKIFLPICVPAMYDDLAADELFGHEPNSFTGAIAARPGAFARADKGTLFLDEIADMRLSTQAALLRVIECGEFKSIGADLPRRVDVRIIAATNQNLLELIRLGRFRADLYDRLRVFEIRVPALRERRQDIPLLASHFLAEFGQREGCAIRSEPCSGCKKQRRAKCAGAGFYERLQSLDWPGNVRELRKVIIGIRLAHRKTVLDTSHVPPLKPMSSDTTSTRVPSPWDAESGLDYFGAKYLAGSSGRFSSADPKSAGANVHNPQSWNGYTYALNNPLAYVDPNGMWPFYIHNRVYQFAFGGALSKEQLKSLKNASWSADFGKGMSDPENAFRHSMRSVGQDVGVADQKIYEFIMGGVNSANALSNGGKSINNAAMEAFGFAIHAITDLGDPAHVSAEGSPLVWSDATMPTLAHLWAERSESVDWLQLGQTIRFAIAGFSLAFPKLAQQQGDLDHWAQRAIEQYVNALVPSSRAFGNLNSTEGPSYLAQELARQCALGNRAACEKR